MKTVNKLVRMAVLCLLVLCGSSYFVSCNNSEYDGKEAEQLAEQFYTYYIDNYGNVGNNCEEIASKYLTDDFAKDYISYMKMQYPIDLLSSGTMYEDGKTFFGSFNKAEYIGEDKVNVTFDKPDGGQFRWLLTISKVGSEYRIAKVEVNNKK